MKFNKSFYKISVWCILAVVVTIAIIISIISGNSIGFVNSFVVFTAFTLSGLVIICIELVYILSTSIFKATRSRLTNIKVDRSTSISETINLEHPILTRKEKIQQAFDLFLLKSKLENISNLTAKQRARIRMKKTYIVQYADLMTDLFMFGVYLTILTLIVLSSRDSLAYYSTRASIRQFMNRRYFYNETKEPINIESFLEYLQNDFLPTIHTGETFFFDIFYVKCNRCFFHTDSNNQSSNGWLTDKRVKILGVSRLRQQRVKKDSCKSKGVPKTQNCLPMLDETTEDKANYDPSWKQQSNIKSKEKYWRILQPWIYQNSLESQTMPQFGKSMLYAGGGYVCNFGRTLANSLVIVEFIKKHNWIDRQTRVIFIEFTTYGKCYNKNLCLYCLATISTNFRCRFEHFQCNNIDSRTNGDWIF